MSRRKNQYLQQDVNLVVAHPSTAATLVRNMWTAPFACQVDSVGYRNATGLTKHADNHFKGNLTKTGGAVVATLFDTETDADPAGADIPAGTLVAGVLGAGIVLSAGDVLIFTATKAGTQTLPEGTLEINARRI